MLRCTPFLLFDGRCAEAMSFYHDCLGGSLLLTKLGDTPMKAQFPPDKHGRIYGQFYDKYGVQWIFRGDARKQAGPTRAPPDRSLESILQSSLSSVIGSSRIRLPVALYTALAME